MTAPVVLIGGAAAVALYLKGQQEEGRPIVPGQPVFVKPLSGVSVSLQASMPGGRALVNGIGSSSGKSVARTATLTSTQGNSAASAALDTVQREAEKYVQQNVDKLSDAAKKAGAAKINAAYPQIQPPLTGKESYKDIAKIVGAVAAAAGCSAVPGLAVAAPLCGIAGAYLGVKGAELAKRAGKVISDRAKQYADAAGDAASKVWNSVF